MKLLILGGTVFVGRRLVEAVLARGHEVTLFNRGQHNGDLFPEAEKLRGDRAAEGGARRAGGATLGRRRRHVVMHVPRVVVSYGYEAQCAEERPMPDWSFPEFEWDDANKEREHMSDTVEQDARVCVLPEGYPEQVPEFATEEEERDFWDTHDSTYYLDGTEDVTHNPPPELGRGPGREGSRARRRPDKEHVDLVQLLLHEDTIAAIRDLARRRRTSPQALMDAWITERLAQEQERRAP